MAKIKPYAGSEPYIFISYAHKNSDIVMPIVERLVADGYRVWYDEGIVPGSEWDGYIAEKILNCSCMLSMISSEYIESKNCRDELKYAREMNKEQLLVYLLPTKLPPGIQMRLGTLQAVFKYSYHSENDFYLKVYEAKILNCCKSTTSKSTSEQLLKAEYVPKKHEGLIFKSYGDSKCALCGIGTCKDEKITIPRISYDGDIVTFIADGAFYNCKNITNIIIPDCVTRIGHSAFSKSTLSNIFLANSVTSIGSYAFFDCSYLKQIHIPNRLTDIPEGFCSCSGLISIDLPENIEFISKNAFDQCNNLTNIAISNTLAFIGTGAFSCCHELTHINYNGTKSEWQNIKKELFWSFFSGKYTIHCLDGEIQKKLF